MAVNRTEKVKLNITKVSKWKQEIDLDDFEPCTEFVLNDIPRRNMDEHYYYSQNTTITQQKQITTF